MCFDENIRLRKLFNKLNNYDNLPRKVYTMQIYINYINII